MAKRNPTTPIASVGQVVWMPDVPSRRDLVKGFAEAILSTPHVFEQVCRELNDQTKLDAVAIASVKLVHAIERELKREGGDAA